MKAYESIVATSMTLSLLAGCAATPNEMPGPLQDITTEVVKADVNQAYSEAQQFWAGQGATSVPSLVMPEDKPVTCGTEVITPAKGKEVTAAACFVTNTLFV